MLNPTSAIFREGSLLLLEESGVADPAPYHAVLAAISAGAARRSEIAGRIGRLATAIAHRPDHLRDLVTPAAADRPRLLLFSRAGFTTDAQRLAAARTRSN